MHEEQKEFGRILRLIRKQKGMSLDDLVRRGLDKSYLSEVERGKRNVSLRYINRVIEALHMEMPEFFWFWELYQPSQKLTMRVRKLLDWAIQMVDAARGEDLARELMTVLKEGIERLSSSPVQGQKRAQENLILDQDRK